MVTFDKCKYKKLGLTRSFLAGVIETERDSRLEDGHSSFPSDNYSGPTGRLDEFVAIRKVTLTESFQSGLKFRVRIDVSAGRKGNFPRFPGKWGIRGRLILTLELPVKRSHLATGKLSLRTARDSGNDGIPTSAPNATASCPARRRVAVVALTHVLLPGEGDTPEDHKKQWEHFRSPGIICLSYQIWPISRPFYSVIHPSSPHNITLSL